MDHQQANLKSIDHLFKLSRQTYASPLSQAILLRLLQRSSDKNIKLPASIYDGQSSCLQCYSIRIPGITSKTKISTKNKGQDYEKVIISNECMNCASTASFELEKFSTVSSLFGPKTLISNQNSTKSVNNSNIRTKIRKRNYSLKNLVAKKKESQSKSSTELSLNLESFFKPA